ncbi:hypothetical protein [Kitasatospora sp. NPDC058190]|uniref:hypothetical protein n=1 Tax=Kitasatospora sp. NPDC058190 TaxID=3346371 RepID=UPI0036DA73A9
MTSNPPLTDDERQRWTKMVQDALNALTAEAALQEGPPDQASKQRLLDRSAQARSQLDADFALGFIDRLGADTLTQAVKGFTPAAVQTSIDALVKADGGVVPLLRNRITRLKSPADENDGTMCAIGAFSIVAGVVIDGILGGIAAVGGILVMADAC